MSSDAMDGVCELTKHQLLLDEILIEGIQLCRGDGTLIVEAITCIASTDE